jgi:hypothetical protein
MEQPLFEATGVRGKVMLFRDVVRIKRTGLASLLSGASRIEKDILISQIMSIQFKKAGLVNSGYIEFVLTHMHGQHDEEEDEDAPNLVVEFRPGQQEAFEHFREALEGRMGGGPAKAPSAAGADLDELQKLASLRDKGVVTQDEFEQKKRRLLGL